MRPWLREALARISPGGREVRHEPAPSVAGEPGPGVASGSPAAPACVGALCGIALAITVFLPWYAINLGPPFTTGSASGWAWTAIAKAAFALGLVAALTGLALVLEARQVVRLQPEVAIALAWTLVGVAAIALVLVAYRVLVPPEPAALLSRDFGLYLAMIAALGGLVAGVAQLSSRH